MNTEKTIDYTNGTEVYEVLSRFVNGGARDKDAFFDAFFKDHRTLQQSVVRLLLELLMLNSQNGWTDARNEAGAKVCDELITAFLEKNGYYPHEALPFI